MAEAHSIDPPLEHPTMVHAASEPKSLLQSDGVEVEYHVPLMTSLSDSNLFMHSQKQKMHYERPGNMKVVDVDSVEIDAPKVIQALIDKGCTPLSKVRAFHPPQEASSENVLFHITIPMNQKYEDGRRMEDGSGNIFCGRIFVAHYSKEFGLEIVRPKIKEDCAIIKVKHFCCCMVFGYESSVHMLRWDSDFNELKGILCKEKYLLDEDGVSVLESQNMGEDLDNYLEYHKNSRERRNDAMFESVDHSKRCISAATFLKKCFQESSIFSYELVPIPYLFWTATKGSFHIVGHDSAEKEIERSRPIKINLDKVLEYKKPLRSLEQDDIDKLDCYTLDVKAPIFWQLYAFGPFGCDKPNQRRELGFRSETNKTHYEVNIEHKGTNWKIAVIFCAFDRRAANQPDSEIRKLEHNLKQIGYTIIYATEKELCKRHFEDVIQKIKEKSIEGICGIKVWIIAHGEERGQEFYNVDDEVIRLVDLYIKTDDGYDVKVSDFLKEMSQIAQHSREEMDREFPVICNICCCRKLKKDDTIRGEKLFAQTPDDLSVMYSASSGQLTSDNSTFIDEWVKYYANLRFEEEALELVTSEIKNNVSTLNREKQLPTIEQKLRYTCKNGVYVLNS